jgi:hypothetical protein
VPFAARRCTNLWPGHAYWLLKESANEQHTLMRVCACDHVRQSRRSRLCAPVWASCEQKQLLNKNDVSAASDRAGKGAGKKRSGGTHRSPRHAYRRPPIRRLCSKMVPDLLAGTGAPPYCFSMSIIGNSKCWCAHVCILVRARSAVLCAQVCACARVCTRVCLHC